MIQTKRNYKKSKSNLTRKQRGGGQKSNKLSLNKRCKVNKKFSSKTKKGGMPKFFKDPFGFKRRNAAKAAAEAEQNAERQLYTLEGEPGLFTRKLHLPSNTSRTVKIEYKKDIPYKICINNITQDILPNTYAYFDSRKLNSYIIIPNINITLKVIKKEVDNINLNVELEHIERKLLSNELTISNNNNTFNINNMQIINELISIISHVDFGKLVTYYKYKTSTA